MYDVVISFYIKDLVTIDFCLKGCLLNLNPRKIYVLTSLKNKPLFEKYNQVKVIDENSFFKDLNVARMIYHWARKNPKYIHKTPRWFYQQLLKMASSYQIKDLTKDYLILDADTVFLRPVTMKKDNKALMCFGTEYHQPYFKMIKKLLQFNPDREYSFIVHHQLINKKLMKEMLKKICDKNRQDWQNKWYKILLEKYDYSQKNGFSEYETYGHFLKHFFPKSFKLRKLRWTNSSKIPNNKLLKKLVQDYHFVSFHTSWRKKSRYLFSGIERIKSFFR